ncbi:MAG: insulinase family protein [Anaerolineaceae bacterium]|nr:insulinase family protein [Anaerolineaceae bacterium]
MNATVNKHILDNGLTILTKEIHHAPLISHWVWYRVGSRNEIPGKTGISHWLEHMQFKGTPNYPFHVLNAEISKVGGFWNAMTYLDWTTYYETLPADQAEIAFDLEADRMVNSVFDPKETELERSVVISEREGNENEPVFRLSERMQKASFDFHPYAQQVIGEKEDLRTMTRDDLLAHYHQYYTPANAVVAIAGDFKTGDLIHKLSKKYENVRGKKPPLSLIQPEEKISTSKNITVEGPGDTVFLQISYRAPRAVNDDFFALMVLDSLLTGPASLSMFGGGSVSNKTSRLYQKLVEKDLSMSISGNLQSTIDPFLYNISAITSTEKDINLIMQAIDKEIGQLQDNFVSQKEINRAIKQAKALFAYGSESITNQAFWMGYSSMFGDHTWFDTFIPNLEKVNRKRILETAQKYLDPNHRIVGVYRPSGKGKK